MKKIIGIIIPVLAVILLFSACSKKAIDDLYTNPDAIIDLLRVDATSVEANDPDFIYTGEYITLPSILDGIFGTKEYRLVLDSLSQSFTVDVGDTVQVNELWAKEADATVNYRIFYSLTLKNLQGDTATKQLVTDSTRAYKRAYMLQLGSFSSSYRGWAYWGTSVLFPLTWPTSNISWSSNQQGVLNSSSNITQRNELLSLSPGELITVQYRGQSDDIAYLTVNESGTPEHIRFHDMGDGLFEADWRVSSDHSGKEFYFYAGVEVYPFETLAGTSSTFSTFHFAGLMYRIED